MSTDYSKLTVKDLQDHLKERGLSTTGKKAELVERLKEADKGAAEAKPAEEVEINWDDDEATAAASTTAGSAAIAAGGQGQVKNPQSVPNQQPAIDPAATDDLSAKKTVQAEVDGKEATKAATEAEAAADSKPAVDFSVGLAATSVDDEIAKRKRRAAKYGLNVEDDETLKNLERQKRFGASATEDSTAGIDRLDQALPERRKRGRGGDGEEVASYDDAGLKRRRGGFRGGRGGGRFRGRGGAGGGGGGGRERTRDGGAGWMNDADRARAEARRAKFA